MNDYKKFKELIEPVLTNIKIAILIALLDAQSTGTYDTIRKAKKINKQVIIIKV